MNRFSVSVSLFSLLAGLTAGILLAPRLDLSWALAVAPAAIVLALARPRTMVLAAFISGALLRGCHEPKSVHLFDDGYPVRALGVLESGPRLRTGGYELDLELERVGGKPWAGRARLSFFPEDAATDLLFRSLSLGSGDRIEVLVRLRRPSAYRDPGVFDYRRHLEIEGIQWTGTIRSPRLIQVLDRGWHGLDRLRAWATHRIGRYFADDPVKQAVVLGMVLGQRGRLPARTREAFQAAGLVHLLVVSGFHLALVAAGASWLGARVGLPRPRSARLSATLGVVLAYALLVQSSAGAARATLTIAFLVAGAVADRKQSAGHALGAAAVAILIVDPLSVLDSGFQMTFTAVLAILVLAVPAGRWGLGALRSALGRLSETSLDGYLSPEIADWRVSRRLGCELKGRPLWTTSLPWVLLALLLEAALVTVSVQAALLPLTVESYHRISPVSLPLNLLGALVAAAVTPAGLLLLPAPELLGRPLAWLMARALDVLLAGVEGGLAAPGATLRVPSPPQWVWALYLLTLVGLACGLARRSRLGTSLALTGAVALQVAVVAIDFAPAPPRLPVLTFLDVGQGASTLIELPNGKRILVDGGGTGFGAPEDRGFSIGEDVVSAHLFSLGIRRLDAVALTHAHHDHMDGLFDVIENFQVGEVWLGRNPVVPRYRDLLETIYRARVPIRWLRAGQRIGPFQVLNPPGDYRTGTEVRNDESLVLMLEWGPSRALLTGDFEGTLADLPAQVDVLQVPHHGSRNARLNVPSQVRVISVGATNSFGHPDPSQLPALRTDLLGAIRVVLEDPHPAVTFPGLTD